MSAQSLVEKILSIIKDQDLRIKWSRKMILKLIEEGQDEMLKKVKQSQIWSGSENRGFPPYLKTVAGQYRYDITADNLSDVAAITVLISGQSRTVRAKQVQRVFVDVTSNVFDYGRMRYIGDPVFYIYYNPYSSQTTRLQIAPVAIEKHDALENTPASIQFVESGNTTQKFFIEFTWEAPRLTSESIPLVIESDHEQALYDYAYGTILELENPRYANNTFIQRFKAERIPEFNRERTSGAKKNTNTVMRRFC